MKKNLAKALATTVAVLALVAGGATAANATTENVGGGKWIYDADNATVYSNYYHPSSKHRSSVQNRYGLKRSVDKPGGEWAFVSMNVAPSDNHAYWYVY